MSNESFVNCSFLLFLSLNVTNSCWTFFSVLFLFWTYAFECLSNNRISVVVTLNWSKFRFESSLLKFYGSNISRHFCSNKSAALRWYLRMHGLQTIVQVWLSYRFAHLLLPLQHIWYRVIARKFDMAIEDNTFAEYCGDMCCILMACNWH